MICTQSRSGYATQSGTCTVAVGAIRFMVQLLCVVYFDAAPDGFAIFAVGATESRLRGGVVVAMDNFVRI